MVTREIKAKDLAEVEFFYSNDWHSSFKKRGNSFKYYEMGTMGVGYTGIPIAALDNYINKDRFPYINEELENNVPHSKEHWVSMIPKGIVPTYVNNEPCVDSILANMDSRQWLWLKDSLREVDIKSLVELRRDIASAVELKKNWKATLQLRNTTNFKSKCHPTTWKDIALNFPRLQAFIMTLPIKALGYVNIMMYEKGRALQIHRDTFCAPHTEHFININFHAKPKPTFVFDETGGNRYYLHEGVQCYFFNETDLHGMEATEEDHFTVRIDCQFNDQLCHQLGMQNGKVFDWHYLKAQAYENDRRVTVLEDTAV